MACVSTTWKSSRGRRMLPSTMRICSKNTKKTRRTKGGIGYSLEPSGDAFDSTVGCGASLEATAALLMSYLDQYFARVLAYVTNQFCLLDHFPADVRAQVVFAGNRGQTPLKASI